MSAKPPAIAHPTTWKVLENSRNQAATALLASGLSSQLTTVRSRCLVSLISRHDESGYQHIIANWDNYDEQNIQLLRDYGQRLVATTGNMLQMGSLAEKKLALTALSELGLSHAVDAVFEYVLASKHLLHSTAIECLLAMCRRWGEDCRRTGLLTEPLRQNLLRRLHELLSSESVATIAMEAWLLLAHWNDSQQRSLVLNTEQPAHAVMLDHFRKTTDPAVLRLLAGYYWRTSTPRSIQALIAEKTDPQLAIEMARLASDEMLDSLLERLRYSEPLASLELVDAFQAKMDLASRRRLFLMKAASQENMEWVVNVSLQLAESDSPDDQALAAEMLQACRRPALNQIVPPLLRDASDGMADTAHRATRRMERDRYAQPSH